MTGSKGCTRHSQLLGLLILVSCLWIPGLAEARASCQIVDLMPAFWTALADQDAAARLRATVVDPHPDLYNEDYVDVLSGPKWENLVARDRAYVDAHLSDVHAAQKYLNTHVRQYMDAFRGQFPDYRCDFVFYIAPSFGRMDGAAGFVKGQHRIIFAPDVIPRYHKLPDLKVLIDHETFHIYHHQATSVFGASADAVPSAEEALWGEGLATFVSWRMNPGVSLDIALLQPGIPEGAQPHLAQIASDLLQHLHEKDKVTYNHYFVANQQPQGYPPRAGYYVGFLIAQKLASRYTLPQLARLKGGELTDVIIQELRKLGADVPAARVALLQRYALDPSTRRQARVARNQPEPQRVLQIRQALILSNE